MKLTLLSAMLMTAVVGITSANAADYKNYCYRRCSLSGASGGVPRNVDKPANRIEDIHGMADFISQYPGVDSTRIGLLGICGEEGIHLLPPRRTNDSNRLQPLACLIQDLYGAMVCRIHSWILFNNVFSRLQMHELRKSPVAKCFTR